MLMIRDMITISKKNHRRRSSSKEKIAEYDDDERHYKIILGESITPRYKILRVMGEGTFGKVVECWDRELKQYLAIKIIRAIEKYRDAAMIEIEVLETIQRHDPQKLKPCIQLLSWFDFRNHVCMIFERYGLSLYDFLKKNYYHGFRLEHIRHFALQILEAVHFLHDLTLVHTDLKPENILLVNSSYDVEKSIRIPFSTDIKLIDFGSATFDSHHHTAVVSTRHYRAPEVILGLGWTYPCDIWSIGCILVELYTGEALFQTHENLEHLALMEKMLGPIPEHIISKASETKSSKYFHTGKLVWPQMASSTSSQRRVDKAGSLNEIIEHPQFLDLLRSMLQYDPDRRITAKNALQHRFFSSP